MKKILLASLLVGFLLVNPATMAWGPNTHVYIAEEALKDPSFDADMKRVIRENYEYFTAGVHTPDITVKS